jgi:ABC-type glycerol-3-phosphate transport system substrate-binding protein
LYFGVFSQIGTSPQKNLVNFQGVAGMMEIEFSVIEGQIDEANLLRLLQEFEKQHYIHVNLVTIPWKIAWAQNAKHGIYGHGPDVSMIFSSWVGSLAGMNSLRPFTPIEIQALGGAESYFDPIWQTSMLLENPTIWAIPWLGDVRVLFYWKDELRKARIEDFDEAFKNDAALTETLKQLVRSGCQYPLATTTQPIALALHEAAYWVWSAGGDFISHDGKQVLFNQPKALDGFKKYYGLLPYVNPATQNTWQAYLFNDKSSPLYIAGMWVPRDDINMMMNGQLGVAKLPGIAYAGGASLAIWQYTAKYQQAFELIRFLSDQPSVYIQEGQDYYKLPTKREALLKSVTQDNFFNHMYLEAFQSGRSFPTLRLWGSVEDRLVAQIGNIWKDLFATPDQDLDICLHKYLDPLADRLNMALAN